MTGAAKGGRRHAVQNALQTTGLEPEAMEGQEITKSFFKSSSLQVILPLILMLSGGCARKPTKSCPDNKNNFFQGHVWRTKPLVHKIAGAIVCLRVEAKMKVMSL